jgi:hypothetical protein
VAGAVSRNFNLNKEPPMKLTQIIALAAAIMIPSAWTLASAGEAAPAPAAEKTEKATKSKKEGASGDSAKSAEGAAGSEKKAEKK